MRNIKEYYSELICVNPHSGYSLTEGKTYSCTGEWYNANTFHYCYILENDAGVSGAFEKSMFIDLCKHRE